MTKWHGYPLEPLYSGYHELAEGDAVHRAYWDAEEDDWQLAKFGRCSPKQVAALFAYVGVSPNQVPWRKNPGTFFGRED